jgi:hypothetical protein
MGGSGSCEYIDIYELIASFSNNFVPIFIKNAAYIINQ